MDADRFKYGDVQHCREHLKLIVHFGWCFFSVLGLDIYAMMEVKMLTERFITVPGLLDRSQIKEIIRTVGIKKEAN